MPRKKSRRSANSSPSPQPPLVDDLAEALDQLLEEGIGSYDDTTDAGRRRMAELHAGFAAAESLLARVRSDASMEPAESVPALTAVVRYILHWAGEERTLDEPAETIEALRNARRALERATSPTRAGKEEPRHERRSEGAA